MGKEPAKEVWVVRGSVKGYSVYPRQDCNIYDVRGASIDSYDPGGWFDPDWFGNWFGPAEDNI